MAGTLTTLPALDIPGHESSGSARRTTRCGS